MAFYSAMLPLPTRSRRPVSHSKSRYESRQRPKLSDGGHEARRLQPRRPTAVRCSAWLGGVVMMLTRL